MLDKGKCLKRVQVKQITTLILFAAIEVKGKNCHLMRLSLKILNFIPRKCMTTNFHHKKMLPIYNLTASDNVLRLDLEKHPFPYLPYIFSVVTREILSCLTEVSSALTCSTKEDLALWREEKT